MAHSGVGSWLAHYRVARRSPAARHRRSESIAESSDGFDHVTGGAEFGAQALHMHVNRACLNIRRGVPHGFQ
jgi:hypothetical protein